MLIPIGNRIIVEQKKEELSSSIILDGLDDDMLLPKGNVLAIGNDVPKELFSVGDEIYFSELSGERIKHDGEQYLILKLGDVIAKIC